MEYKIALSLHKSLKYFSGSLIYMQKFHKSDQFMILLLTKVDISKYLHLYNYNYKQRFYVPVRYT